MEVDDKTGSGRPFFEGLMPSRNDRLNSHLAYRQIGGSSSAVLFPNTTYNLEVKSISEGNLCVMELSVNKQIVDRNERWNNGDPNNCTIPVSNDGSATIGLPPERLGGISGYNFPGGVLGFRNTRHPRG